MEQIGVLQSGLQGQYRFTNDIFLDIKNSTDDNKHIVIHENVHRELSCMSTIGLLLIMMEKARIVDRSKMWLFDKLLDSSNKLQEQVATNIEYLWILKEYGYEEYIRQVNKLADNKAYAKHFRSLNIINQKIKTADDAEQAINLILCIGILSLNINLDIFPLWEFKSDKDFQRFISEENNNIKYNPNTRFKILIKYFFNPDYGKINSDKIELVDTTTYSKDKISNLCRETIRKIYKDSNALEIIMQRVKSIDNTNSITLDINDISGLSAYPTDLNDENINIVTKFTGLNDIIALLKKDNDAVLKLEHLLGGLENVSLLSYWPLHKNEITVGRYNIDEIIKIVKEVQNPIVFTQSKLYERIGDKILNYSSFRPVFIIMENSIASSLKFIYRQFKGGQYTILTEEKYDILVVIKINTVLIQLVVKDLINEYSNIFPKEKEIDFIDSQSINSINEYLIRSIASASFKFSMFSLKNNGIF